MQADLLPTTSAASSAFRNAVRAYEARLETDRIQTVRSSPRIKVLRVIRQLVEREPHLAIERIRIDALSGCSDFRGSVRVEHADGVNEFEFAWDCQWRAEQQGWHDHFGFPDQIRASREFDWDCFQSWQSSGLPDEQPSRADAALSSS